MDCSGLTIETAAMGLDALRQTQADVTYLSARDDYVHFATLGFSGTVAARTGRKHIELPGPRG